MHFATLSDVSCRPSRVQQSFSRSGFRHKETCQILMCEKAGKHLVNSSTNEAQTQWLYTVPLVAALESSLHHRLSINGTLEAYLVYAEQM